VKQLWIFGADTARNIARPWQRPIPTSQRPSDHCPFRAWKGTDILARALARGLGEVAGLKAFVEKQPGAESVIRHGGSQDSLPTGTLIVVGEQFDPGVKPAHVAATSI